MSDKNFAEGRLKTLMWTPDKNFEAQGFYTPPWRLKKSSPPLVIPATERKYLSPPVPSGDSPYVRAKHVQLIDKDPGRAISMFWSAINSGDRVDSALKDMAVVMKQLNRSDEAIEAIKSFRHLCSLESQDSLDNILLELYKQSRRVDEQIELLQVKLKHIEDGIAFGGKRSKTARSQGKKVEITIEQDYSRLLGNLAWAFLQQDNYTSAEALYRKALSFETDKNKQCNLALCLMYTQRMTEAKFLLQTVSSSCGNGQIYDSYAKSYERAVEVMNELESEIMTNKDIQTPFSVFLERNMADVYKKETTSQFPRTLFGNNVTRGSYRGRPFEGRAEFSDGSVPKDLFTQPRMCLKSFTSGDQKREDVVGACNRKLSFDQPSSAKSMPSGKQVLDIQSTGTVLSVEKTQDVSRMKSNKKSWADMVEEEEQELYGDENLDCNIIPETPIQNNHSESLSEKIASLNMKEGYHTQPGKSVSFSIRVKRTLCFNPPSQQNANEENLCSSPLRKQVLEFGNCKSELVNENECVSGCSAKSVKRSKLHILSGHNSGF